MSKMSSFCDFYFETVCFYFIKANDLLPSLKKLYNDLRKLSSTNVGSSESRRGLGYFSSTQTMWSDPIIKEFCEVRSEFVSVLKEAIWRPSNSRKVEELLNTEDAIERRRWLVPLEMPKLHTLEAHVGTLLRNMDAGLCFRRKVSNTFRVSA